MSPLSFRDISPPRGESPSKGRQNIRQTTNQNLLWCSPRKLSERSRPFPTAHFIMSCKPIKYIFPHQKPPRKGYAFRGGSPSSIIFRVDFKVALRVVADRANFRSLSAYYDVPAVSAQAHARPFLPCEIFSSFLLSQYYSYHPGQRPFCFLLLITAFSSACTIL